MNTLTQWIENKKEWYSGNGNKPIRDALDDLISSLPQLLETMKAEMLEKVGEDYVESFDNDGHRYQIPHSKMSDWFKFNEIPLDDERSWEVPEWAERIDGMPVKKVDVRTIIQDYFSK